MITMVVTIDFKNKTIKITGETSLVDFLKFIESTNLEGLDQYKIVGNESNTQTKLSTYRGSDPIINPYQSGIH